MGRSPVLAVLSLVVILNVIVWSSSSRFSPSSLASRERSSPVLSALGLDSLSSTRTPLPSLGTLAFPFPEIPEPPHDSGKWAVVPLLLVYVVALLASLGICAGDFLVVNLATIADGLGMSEDTAGVTLLALGNGSPDVFSTYAAFQAGSGSLAIGELLGAATFIISVVVGSMALVKPFQVHPGPFLRDVGFALVSVSLLLGVLHDGHLQPWEALSLVMMYGAYVLWVVGGARIIEWRERKRVAREDALAQEENGRNRATESDRLLPAKRQSRASYSALGVQDSPLPSDGRRYSTPHDDSETTDLLRPPQAFDSPSLAYIRPSLLANPRRARSRSITSSLDVRRTTFSLLGAVEFRDVVKSLQEEGEDLSTIDHIPTSPFASGHYHHLPQAIRSARSIPSTPSDTFSLRRSQSTKTVAPRGTSSPTHSHRRLSDPQRPLTGRPELPSPGELSIMRGIGGTLANEFNPWSHVDVDQNGPKTPRPSAMRRASSRGPMGEAPSSPPASPLPLPKIKTDFPAITLAPPPNLSGSLEPPSTPPTPQLILPSPFPHSSKRSHLRHMIRVTLHTFFPTLVSLRHKSLTGKVLSFFAAPIVLMLTLTLPVVETEADDEPACLKGEEDWDSADEERVDVGDGLEGRFGADLDEFRAQIDGEETVEERAGLGFNKWLLCLQCIIGPAWCSMALFWDADSIIAPIVICSLGLASALATVVFASDGENRFGKLARCFLGFSVAMIWIMVIADEVVTILTTLGHVFGLSDAIIGVTIFAIGNSTADLVANLSIASFAPIMAFSACFGGPMLNILLGVGLSGAFVTLSSGKAYPIAFSPTLVASTCGLLTLLLITLIVVPLNGWHITCRWGTFLIFFYVASMTANVLAEVFLEG